MKIGQCCDVKVFTRLTPWQDDDWCGQDFIGHIAVVSITSICFKKNIIWPHWPKFQSRIKSVTHFRSKFHFYNPWKRLEAALHRCSWEKVFWEYAWNPQEICCIFSRTAFSYEHLRIVASGRLKTSCQGTCTMYLYYISNIKYWLNCGATNLF